MCTLLKSTTRVTCFWAGWGYLAIASSPKKTIKKAVHPACRRFCGGAGLFGCLRARQGCGLQWGEGQFWLCLAGEAVAGGLRVACHRPLAAGVAGSGLTVLHGVGGTCGLYVSALPWSKQRVSAGLGLY